MGRVYYGDDEEVMFDRKPLKAGLSGVSHDI
jgi:hypothetical protein